MKEGFVEAPMHKVECEGGEGYHARARKRRKLHEIKPRKSEEKGK